MKLSIIIPTKERKEIFESTLSAAINATRHLDAEIIIVNDSRTECPQVPTLKHVHLVQNPKAGVASARNYGFRMSVGDLILFLDNDIIISKASVDHVLSLHLDRKHACYNLNWEYSGETLKKIHSNPFTRFLSAFQMISFKGWYNDASWKDNDLFASKSVASFHLSILRKDFEKTGGYNEEFPFAGFEDYDFPLRLRNAGIEFFIDSRVTVCHNETDRLDLDNWLTSQQNRAYTRKIAVRLGFQELALKFDFPKELLFRVMIKSDFFLRKVLKAWPSVQVADPVYFRLLAALQASRIYKGYNESSE